MGGRVARMSGPLIIPAEIRMRFVTVTCALCVFGSTVGILVGGGCDKAGPDEQRRNEQYPIGRSAEDFTRSIPLLSSDTTADRLVGRSQSDGTTDTPPSVFLDGNGWSVGFVGDRGNVHLITMTAVYSPKDEATLLEQIALAHRLIQVASGEPDLSRIGPWLKECMERGGRREFGGIRAEFSGLATVPGQAKLGFGLDIVHKDNPRQMKLKQS